MSDRQVYEHRWRYISQSDSDLLGNDKYSSQTSYFYSQYIDYIVNFIKYHSKDSPLNKLRILEIGCGRGTVSIALQKAFGCHVSSIDFSQYSIDLARRNAAKHSANISFYLIDVMDTTCSSYLEEHASSFDFILSVGVLEHISDLSLWFARHSQLLKVSGSFIAMVVPEHFSIQYLFEPINRVFLILHRLLKGSLSIHSQGRTRSVHRNVISDSAYHLAAEGSSFSDLRITYVNPYPTIKPLPSFLERTLITTYRFLDHFSTRFSLPFAFFGGSKTLSRAFFLTGTKTK